MKDIFSVGPASGPIHKNKKRFWLHVLYQYIEQVSIILIILSDRNESEAELTNVIN